MSQIQQGRYDGLLRRVADLKGPGSFVNDALSELFPTLDVENVPGELLILGQTDICMGSADLTAAVAERASIQLFNPAGSGKIVVCTRVLLSASANQLIFGSTFPIGGRGAATGNQMFRDTRRGILEQPTASIHSRSIPGVILQNFTVRVTSARVIEVTDPNGIFVLAPDLGMEFQGQLTNSNIAVTYFWRERVAEPSELKF